MLSQHRRSLYAVGEDDIDVGIVEPARFADLESDADGG